MDEHMAYLGGTLELWVELTLLDHGMMSKLQAIPNPQN